MSKAAKEMARALRRVWRASVLRPWHGECLILRAADPRIGGRVLARRTLSRWPERGRGEVVRRDAWPARRMSVAEGERLGLWRLLEELRCASWQKGRRRAGDLVAVELVTIDGPLLARVCRWPKLGERCTVTEAARLLGVSRQTIRYWIRRGKLASREAVGAKCRDTRVYVGYTETSRELQRVGGPKYRRPERAKRMMIEEPSARWAAERFRKEGRRELVVRVRRLHGSGGPGGLAAQPRWACPTCGREVQSLYLPAGRLARAGRTWSSWRLQCQECTGVENEGWAWAHGRVDALGRWALKMSCGLVGRGEWDDLLDEHMGGGRAAAERRARAAARRRERHRRRRAMKRAEPKAPSPRAPLPGWLFEQVMGGCHGRERPC